MLPVTLSECEILFLALKEEHKLRVLDEDEETEIFEPTKEEVM